MNSRRALCLAASALLVVSCANEPTRIVSVPGQGIRIVNGFTLPVDVLVDGALARSAIAAGQVDSVLPATGTHTVTLQVTGALTTVTLQVESKAGVMRTVAAV